MYIARLGFLDGMAGLRFCFYHAWFEMNVASLRAEARVARGGPMSETGAFACPEGHDELLQDGGDAQIVGVVAVGALRGGVAEPRGQAVLAE